MNRYLLLILLSSFAHVVPLSLQCDTGFANPNHALSLTRSLLNNADVALLKTYHAETLDKCITDCCAEKFGLCSVASYKNTTTEGNCQHFNCRPVTKCIFLSSNLTDSFTFTSSSLPRVLVPSSNASKDKPPLSTTVSTSTKNEPRLDKSPHSEPQHGVTKETVAAYSGEQLAFSDDNTTVKPRKGVEDVTEISIESVSRSGVKPRKGVDLDGINASDNNKSKVKPRKGVGPYRSFSVSAPTVIVEPTVHKTSSSLANEEHSTKPSMMNSYKDIADDVVSALKKVFEDDTIVKDIRPSMTSSVESVKILHTASTMAHSVIPTTVATVHSTTTVENTPSSTLQSSLATNYVAPGSVQQHTPDLATFAQAAEVVNHTTMPLLGSPTILEHSKLLFHEFTHDGGAVPEQLEEDESSVESESERKYKSSMHLVLSLVFGLLVLFSVFGVVAKRVYDGWMRRHYRRMDFLIDGMYNGYG